MSALSLLIKSLKNKIFGPVSLTLLPGQSLVVSGVSGSGKTRFLRAVADLDEAGGDILLNGRSFRRMMAHDWRRQVRFVPADSGWWLERVGPHFKAFSEEVADKLEALEKKIEIVGLRPDILEAELRDISTGERQRLAFLRAIEDEPDVLLLDEPTSALDENSTKGIEALIDEQLQRGAIVMIASHSERQAEKYGGRRLTFQPGGIALFDEGGTVAIKEES